MIRGIHGLFYSSDPKATRDFFRNQVKLPGSDIGGEWWIFDFAEGDMGVHPANEDGGPGHHDISFYCDDIEGTVADLKSRGVSFTAPVADHGYGLVTYFEAPGGLTVQLYEPRYVKGTSRFKSVKKAAAPKKKTVVAKKKSPPAKRKIAAAKAKGGASKKAKKKR
jgi:hypothetical protein